MYEERNENPIVHKQFALAASLVLTQIEYRDWSSIEFGKYYDLHEHRLFVYFDRNTKPKSVKVRSSNCEEFKKYENPYAVLTHPGAITMANKQLSKFGKTLNDRLYMRYDGDSGPLKVYGKTAIKCQYCGMEPLPTDISAEKD